MRLLCIYLLLQTVSTLAAFRGYHGGSRVCDQWKCLNGKFNFTEVLPQKDRYSEFIKGRLPAEWHILADNAVDRCYEFQTMEKYTNTCPGQGLLHCVMDKLIQGCPLEYWQQRDACAPVSSLAGNNYMFSQSRYENLQENMPLERRSAQFLENYFKSKCCDLPQLFNDSLLSECGFTEMLHYIYREANLKTAFRSGPSIQDVATKRADGNVVGEVYNFHMLPETTTSASNFEYATITDEEGQDDQIEEIQDPLDCCQQIDDFIQPNWRAECDFELKWDSKHRLTYRNYNDDIPTNTKQCKDLPPAMSCVLNNMGLLNQWGFVNHFGMKNRIREYSNYRPSYLYEVLNAAFLFAPWYDDFCNSPRKLFNLLDAMLLVCDLSKRRTNHQCNIMFTEISNSLSNTSRVALDEIQRNSNRGSGYVYDGGYSSRKLLNNQQSTRPTLSSSKVKFNTTYNAKRYDFGVLGLLGTPPPVSLIDLKPKNKTLVLLPVYQRTPKHDPLAINSLHNDGVLRG
ncbi:uncharacterized protein LOC123870225 [Maniola jurtina]|uniref:uncharacterized protein LOC123870225 n=1 Tax=Maniola jurtina TaxID=191418 RepID=UPI001E68E6A5|nr:uncharacterized protein LOC123870225 [Maniola jurtina]